MSLKLPFFSVVIATYNRAHLLPRALESLLHQTEKDWEAVIVDDGSTDETKEIIQQYKSDRFRYYHQENQGFIKAKNAGIARSKAKFITFLDSDDAYEKDHLFLRKEYLIKNPHLDFIHGGVRIIGQPFVPDVNNPNQKIHLSECFIGGTYCFNKKAVQQLKGFGSTALGTDFDMMQRAEKSDLIIEKVDFPTYIYYRDAGSSITNDMLRSLD